MIILAKLNTIAALADEIGWCTALYALLDASDATDTAIRDAVDAYLRARALRK